MPDTCSFDVTPLDQSHTIDTPSLRNLNYTSQEFWSLKRRMYDIIRTQFAADFNDFVEGDLAIMLLENWAFIADLLSFKMDQIANEIFIDTVTEVENAFRLAKLVGFKPQPPIAATSRWKATITNVLDVDLIIPAGLEVSAVSQQQPITIELFPADSNFNPINNSDIIITAGSTVNTSIVGIEGHTTSDIFSGDGTVGQNYQLSLFPVIWDSLTVQVDGVTWQEVDYFTDSNPRREYRVEFDSDYHAFVIFGNGRAGMLPGRGSEILVTYRQGGGPSGNIVTGSITTQRTISVEGFEFVVPVSFTNYTKGSYGYSGDTIEDVRRKLPAYLRTQGRAVSGTDYKTLTDQFATPYNGQIGKSTAVLRNYGCAANIIDLYILAKNGQDDLNLASNELKSALQEMLTDVKMLTDFVCIRDGVIVDVDISIDIVIDKFWRKFEDELRARINRAITLFFSLNRWEYGQDLKDTDLIKSLSDIKEAKSFEVAFVTNQTTDSLNFVSTKFFEIIRPDQINISFLYE
jgi:hypothetical protein